MAAACFVPPRNVSRTHGSSLRELGAPLDQERAASMADEGGMAGAITDAAAQESRLRRDDASEMLERAARTGARVWPWAMLIGGAVLAAAAWQSRKAEWW